jgi:hypothetical protein
VLESSPPLFHVAAVFSAAVPALGLLAFVALALFSQEFLCIG